MSKAVKQKKYTKADGNFVIISEQRPKDRAPMEWREEICNELEIENRKYYSTREEAQIDVDKVNARLAAKAAEGGKGFKYRYVVKDVSPKGPDTRRKTCQICARPILANTGVIAHHGYKVLWNEFHGSCQGAMELSFEKSRSVLESHIAGVRSTILTKESYVQELNRTNDPLQETRKVKLYLDESVNRYTEYKKFDYTPGTPEYVSYKRQLISKIESEIRNLIRYTEQQQVRYDEWIQKEEV